MQKINFQDLPNQTTPINATNLNAIQNNVETAIADATTSVIDSLDSTSTTDALSANQGKVLNEKMFPMEILANNYNIDNIKKSGFYGIFNAAGTLPTGYSTSDNNIFIESIMWSSDYGRQIMHDVRTKNTYIRNLSANTWHSWSQIV